MHFIDRLYIGKKNVYYEDPVFKKRVLPPLFQTREEALELAKEAIAKISGPRWFDISGGGGDATGGGGDETGGGGDDETGDDESADAPEMTEDETAAMSEKTDSGDAVAPEEAAGETLFEDAGETGNFLK